MLEYNPNRLRWGSITSWPAAWFALCIPDCGSVVEVWGMSLLPYRTLWWNPLVSPHWDQSNSSLDHCQEYQYCGRYNYLDLPVMNCSPWQLAMSRQEMAGLSWVPRGDSIFSSSWVTSAWAVSESNSNGTCSHGHTILCMWYVCFTNVDLSEVFFCSWVELSHWSRLTWWLSNTRSSRWTRGTHISLLTQYMESRTGWPCF